MSKHVADVISIGKINIDTGVTEHGWSIYENGDGYIHLINGGHLIFDSGKLEVGMELELRGNDSGRKLKECVVVDTCKSQREDVLEMLLRNRYDYYPVRPFKKKRYSNKLGISYSLKGVS